MLIRMYVEALSLQRMQSSGTDPSHSKGECEGAVRGQQAAFLFYIGEAHGTDVSLAWLQEL